MSLRITVDGKERLCRTPFIFIGNNAYIMEGFDIGKREGLCDGKLSVYFTRDMTRMGLVALGFRITATSGTAVHLSELGMCVDIVNKVQEGRPHIVDHIKNGEIALVVNTVRTASAQTDSLSIRREALHKGVPYYTTMAGAKAAAQAIAALKGGSLEVAPLQSYSS